MRIDRLLWFLRLAGSRSYAQKWVLAGHIRLNSQRVVKPNTDVAVGDVLTLPMKTQVRVIDILALPRRRGPAAEAQACYRVLDAKGAMAIAGEKARSDAQVCEGQSLP
tara:strand:- start:1110 stop:1433 length:324 start_codon:yes stop_codon:yes gene_type:complete